MSSSEAAASGANSEIKKNYVRFIQKTYSSNHGINTFLKKALNNMIEVIILHGGRLCKSRTVKYIAKMKRKEYDVVGSGNLKKFRRSKVLFGAKISYKLKYQKTWPHPSLYIMEGSVQLVDVCTLKIHACSIFDGCNYEEDIDYMEKLSCGLHIMMFISFNDTYRDRINDWVSKSELHCLYRYVDKHQFEYICLINNTLRNKFTVSQSTFTVNNEDHVILQIETPHS